MNNINDPLQLLRKEYAERMLRRDELNANPLVQFDAWMNEAVQVQMDSPGDAWSSCEVSMKMALFFLAITTATKANNWRRTHVLA
jgi:hypothetical protein